MEFFNVINSSFFNVINSSFQFDEKPDKIENILPFDLGVRYIGKHIALHYLSNPFNKDTNIFYILNGILCNSDFTLFSGFQRLSSHT